MAVQIVAYELYLARGRGTARRKSATRPLATATEMDRLRSHLEEVMTEVGFR